MRALLLLFCLLSLDFHLAHAQEFLSLDSAIARALRYNYDVRIADVSTQVAAANNTLGNAGLLPTLSGTGSVNEGNAATKLVSTDGTVRSNPSANTFSYAAGVNASFTVFAAGRAYLVKKQLSTLEAFTSAQLRAQVESTISGVIQSYASVVNDVRQTVAIDTAIALAQARMELSRAKYELGSAAKVDYLQARVDYNAARSQRLSQDASQAASQAALNELMGQDAEATYIVADSLDLNLALQPADSALLYERNPLLLVQRINIELRSLDRRIARTYYYPTVTPTVGYNYTRSQSDASVFLSNRSLGPSVGIGLNVPIFQGGNVRRQVRVASLNELTAELQYNRQERAISRQYRSAWAAYESAVAVYRLEDENRGYAKENLDIQQARFRVGVANTLELREAENSYVATLARYYAARYNAKVAETRVLEVEARLDE